MNEKLLKIVHKLPMKLYLILAAFVLFTFFSNNFGQVDIQKTAIIVAAGIDKQEETYTLTAQIALPSGAKDSAGTKPLEVHGQGKTVADCVTDLYARTGRVPKFIFCNLLVLSEDCARESALAALDFFLRSEYISDSCFLAVCEGKAEELLTAKSAVDDYTSDAITKLFSDASVKAGRVCPVTLREFSIASYGVSQCGYMPFLRANAFESQEKSGGEQPASGGEQEQPSEKKIFTAEETALFSDGKMTGLLAPEQTFAFNLLEGNVFAGAITVDTQEGAQSVTVLKNEGSASLRLKETPLLDFNIKLRVDLNNRSTPSDIHEISDSLPSEELKQNAQALLTEQVASLWESSKAASCDLFFLKRQLFRSSPKEYEARHETLIKETLPNVSVLVEEAR